MAAIWFMPQPLHAVVYDIHNVKSTEVSVGFTLDKYEAAHSTEKPLFFFAIASSPLQTISVHAQADTAGLSGNAKSIPVSPVSKGWAGSSYLKWFTFSPFMQVGRSVTAVMKGTITVGFNAGVLSGQKPSVRNGILYLGTSSSALRKTLASPQPALHFTKGLKLSVEKDGIYQLTGGDLRKYGVPVASIPGSSYKLYNDGIEVPLYVSNSFHSVLEDGDQILFYGRFLRGTQTYLSQFSNTNVYWLTWEGGAPGIRVAEVSGGQRKDITVFNNGTTSQILAHEFRDTIHLEQDNQMLFLGNVNVISEMADSVPASDADDWYWGIIGRDAITDFQIDVPSPTVSSDPSRTARMHIRFQGMSNVASISPNHRLYVYLNDNTPGTQPQIVEWSGQTSFDFISAPFPSSLLANGPNKITFSRVPLGSGQQVQTYPDLSALNWIEIDYYRTFAADSNQLVFKNSSLDQNGIFQFQVNGFTTPVLDLWDIGNSRLFTGFSAQSMTAKGKTSYTLVFQDSLTSAHTFFAQAASKRLAPARMSLDTMRRDWTSIAQADYVVITVDSFFNDFKPLVAAYAKKGLDGCACRYFRRLQFFFGRHRGPRKHPFSVEVPFLPFAGQASPLSASGRRHHPRS